MPEIVYSEDGADVENSAELTGSPAVRITGSNVTFTNRAGGSITGVDSTWSGAIILEGPGATVVNEDGARIVGYHYSVAAILGSAHADTVIAGGTITGGWIDLDDGADVMTQTGLVLWGTRMGDGADRFTLVASDAISNNIYGSTEMQEGDDLAVVDVSGVDTFSWRAPIEGGAGEDRLIVSGFSGTRVDLSTLYTFERVDFVGEGTSYASISYSGWLGDVHLFPGLYLSVHSGHQQSATSAFHLNGGELSVGSRIAIGSVVGSDAAERVSISAFQQFQGNVRGTIDMGGGDDVVDNDGILHGSVSLGAGNDRYDAAGNATYYGNGDIDFYGPGVANDTVDGGEGNDTVVLAARDGRTIDFRSYTGFETLAATNLGVSDLRLSHVSGVAEIHFSIREGRLALADTDAAQTAIVLITNATLGELLIEATTTIGAIRPQYPIYLNSSTLTKYEGVAIRNLGSVTGDVELWYGNDLFDGTGGTQSATVNGYGGDDRLYGGAAADRLYGGADNDLLEGNDGDDVLEGYWGEDVLRGGAGDDVLDGGYHDDVLEGGEGNDRLVSGDGLRDALYGGAGDDRLELVQQNFSDRAAGHFILDGGRGNDRITVELGYFDPSHVEVYAGAGADMVEFVRVRGSASVVLGGGSDTIVLDRAIESWLGTIEIRDFAGGRGGDRIDLADRPELRSAFHWNGTDDLFATGRLRLVQVGADVRLDGNVFGWTDPKTLLTFKNMNTTELTAYNFSGHGPEGSHSVAAGVVRTGGAETDSFEGTAGDDVFRGGGGRDFLRDSLGGDDEIYGEDGNDYIYVERLAAGMFTDVILDGGADDDTIFLLGYSIDGSGDRTVSHNTGKVLGGDGIDFIYISDMNQVELDAGAGDDHVAIDLFGAYAITLGAGRDILELADPRNFYFHSRPVVVKDFATGAAGDRLDLIDYVADLLIGWDHRTSPFPTFLRVRQDGTNTLLEVDRDGAGTGYGFVTLLTFEGRTVADFLPVNLGGWDRNGAAVPGETIGGTADADLLIGLSGDDTISGADGADRIRGGAGDDELNGGESDDKLFGEFGDDVLRGDGGNDELTDRHSGNEEMYGGAGDDRLGVQREAGIAGTLSLHGEDGNDTIGYSGARSTGSVTYFSGGSGRDSITLNADQTATVDAGADDDVVLILRRNGSFSVTLGSGSDTLRIGVDMQYGGTGLITVLDFAAGAGGDILALESGFVAYLQNWTGAVSLVQSGHLRIVASGGDTSIEIDRDGGGNSFVQYALLVGVAPASLTSANLGTLLGGSVTLTEDWDSYVGGWGPDVIDGLGGDDTIQGFAAADQIFGRAGADWLFGEQGDDTLWGGIGRDHLVGGDGNDRLYGEQDDDLLEGGAGDDIYHPDSLQDVIVENAGEGTDTVVVGFSYRLGANLEILEAASATGTEALGFTGNELANTIRANQGNNHINGAAGADILVGYGGNDTYYVDHANDAPVENAGQGTDLVLTTVSYRLTAHVENLQAASIAGTDPLGLTGNDLANTIWANFGNNHINGGGGADILYGYGGNDTYYVDHASDAAVEFAGQGTDLVLTTVSYRLGAHVENLQAAAIAGSDPLGLTGNDLSNVIWANQGHNHINGAGGADVMYGYAGNDTYYVDHAGDAAVEFAGQGTDLVLATVSYRLGAHVENLQAADVGGREALGFTGNDLSNVIWANQGNNHINGAGGADVMYGYAGDDTYYVDHAGDAPVEYEGQGNDLVLTTASYRLTGHIENLQVANIAGTEAFGLTGNDLSNTIWANFGNNHINGAGGADVMYGYGGDDTYYVDHAGDAPVEYEGQGTDLVLTTASYRLTGNIENLQVANIAGTEAFGLTGNDLSNTIWANFGNNHINGAGGADVMYGYGGDDTYYVDHAGDAAIEYEGQGNDLVLAAVSHTLGANLENLQAMFIAGTEPLGFTGNGGSNTIWANFGNNHINGAGGADVMYGYGGDDTYYVDHAGDSAVEYEGQGVDLVLAAVSHSLGAHVENLQAMFIAGSDPLGLTGNDLSNTIWANYGNNHINGAGGADLMYGYGGDDTYYVDNAADAAVEFEGQGTDLVLASVSYTLGAHVERLQSASIAATDPLSLTGNALANFIWGNAGANVINGGAGADSMYGYGGDDVYYVDDAGDAVHEEAGGGRDTVNTVVSYTLGDHVEVLGPGDITARGNIALTGNALDNLIHGNFGSNRIDGKGGNDDLIGSEGDDEFVFSTALDARLNVDTIRDFGGGDRFLLAGGVGDPFQALAAGALSADAFTAGGSATTASHRIVYNSVTGTVFYDADGAGGADAVQFAKVSPGVQLSHAHFSVSGADSPHALVSPDGATVAENSPAADVVYRIAATDPDGDSLAYGISGTHASHFSVDARTGEVRLLKPADFEAQQSYRITVTATDSKGAVASKDVTITVTDVAESAPVYLIADQESNDSSGTAQAIDRSKLGGPADNTVPNGALPAVTIGGSISTGNDKDYFSITLQAGELLILDVDRTDTLDAELRVFGPDGKEIAYNDDPGSFDPGSTAHAGLSHNMDSVIRVRAPTTGTYTFAIGSFVEEDGRTSTGSYTLHAQVGPVATRAQLDEENVESLLSGSKWNSLSLSYGFTSSASHYGPNEGTDEIAAGMQALNGGQQLAVQTILAQFASVTGLGFTHFASSPGSAQLRYALSGEPKTAHAYEPGPGNGGDSWYNTANFNTPTVGNYQWLVFIHETGHALGLKHGHESPALSPDRDSMEYSLMTYRSYVGDPVGQNSGFANETWGYAQTLMMYDIAALQRMYGANFNHNAGDTVYSWSPTSGAFFINGNVQWTPGGNRVFMTLWDGGGADTYDFSSYSDALSIDLRPGEWTKLSDVQRAHLGDGNYARGHVANALLYNNDPRSLIEKAIGGSGTDTLIANQAANVLTGGAVASRPDYFHFHTAADANGDRITDFVSGVDRIDLSQIDAKSSTPENDSFAFLGAGAFSGAGGELRFEGVSGGVRVEGDLDGDRVADFAIVLDNVAAVGAGDFWL